MKKLTKNDKVKIINTNNVWKDKEAIVISQDEEEEFDAKGLDITDVKVKVIFDPENPSKNVVQHFPRYCLELATKNECINEFYITSEDKIDVETFKNYFIGQDCKFNGFDYSKLFKPVRDKDNRLTYTEEDLEVIEYYKDLENINCYISACTLSDSFDSQRSLYDNFRSAYWDIEFDTGDILPAVSGDNLSLKTFKFENIQESIIKPEDYIKDYVYSDTLDDQIPSWFFVDKIAAAENIKQAAIIKDAKLLGYKLYKISAPYFEKIIVAANKCLKSTIIDDYADYLQGDMEVLEI